MISFNVIWLLILIFYIVSFFSVVLIANFASKPLSNETYSFKRFFPFETINHLDKSLMIYKVCIFLFAFLCFSPIFVLVKGNDLFENLSSFAILISLLFGFAGICFTFLHFFNPSNVKTHLILVAIFASLILLVGLLSAFLSLNIFKINLKHGSENYLTVIFGVFSLILSLLEIAIAFTFKLSNWAKLDNQQGLLKRPNFFPLACYEWVSFLTLFLEEISFMFVILKY